MFEIWYKDEQGNMLRASNQKYHNLETAKVYAKPVKDHPAFKKCTIYIYDIAKDRFFNA